MRERHRINEIRAVEIETTYGRFVGARSSGQPYGLYQQEWLVQIKTDSGLTGVTNAPGVADLMMILGKQRVLRRIGRSLGDITSALLDDKPQKPEADKSDKGASSKAVV